VSANNTKPTRPRVRGDRVRRRVHNLSEAFEILDLGRTKGHELVAQDKIKVIWFGPRSPKVTDEEIDRLLREGTTARGQSGSAELPDGGV
jgi:lipocalin